MEEAADIELGPAYGPAVTISRPSNSLHKVQSVSQSAIEVLVCPGSDPPPKDST